MSPIELRVQFKMDTGDYPVWPDSPAQNTSFNRRYSMAGINVVRDPATFHGRLKSSYGLWLEDKMEGSKLMREAYYKEYKKEPVHSGRKFPEWLKGKYITWLEERYINKSK